MVLNVSVNEDCPRLKQSVFLRSQDFLIDMCHTVLNAGDGLRASFLKRTRELLKFAGPSANLRLSDWMSFCLDAIESVSADAVLEGEKNTHRTLSPVKEIESSRGNRNMWCCFL